MGSSRQDGVSSAQGRVPRSQRRKQDWQMSTGGNCLRGKQNEALNAGQRSNASPGSNSMLLQQQHISTLSLLADFARGAGSQAVQHAHLLSRGTHAHHLAQQLQLGLLQSPRKGPGLREGHGTACNVPTACKLTCKLTSRVSLIRQALLPRAQGRAARGAHKAVEGVKQGVPARHCWPQH
ncbi:MAG: hypothetical protein FRX49_10185 [Trebouxia sp. A1-2]|nr:MAG: hypothetical protein FRX49_10185 [Trebouxia sp. A1-2]